MVVGVVADGMIVDGMIVVADVVDMAACSPTHSHLLPPC